jgi:predicted Zn-dependent protease
MAEELLQALRRTRGIDAWKIVERRVEGRELYLIGHRVDMRRAKTVHHLQLTLYRDREREGQHLRGSTTLRLPLDCGRGELARMLERGIEAARWAENPHYPLVRPGMGEPERPASAYAHRPVDLDQALGPLAGALFAAEQDGGSAGLNCAELFAENVGTRIRNSEGVDVGYTSFWGSGELIVEARGAGGEVELFQELAFAQADPEPLREEARRLLALCRDRLQAAPTPALGSFPLLLTGEAVSQLFDYYLFHSSAESAYSRLARFTVGEPVQGREVSGDALNLDLEPYMAHSPRSCPWDEDGVPLRPVALVKDGRLLRFWGSVRHCHYLGIPPTGNIANLRVHPGVRSLEDLRGGGCLEAVSFSDFHCDPITGDFGGELRLAYLVDAGGGRKPVTGGSLSGRIGELAGSLRLSAQTQARPGYHGPEGVWLESVAVTGAK